MDHWLELAVAACDHAGLEYSSVETLVTREKDDFRGAVYRLDAGRILKVYGPKEPWSFHLERAALRTLEAGPAIPAPRIVAAGEPREGPPYLVMTAIPGVEAADAWQSMARDERLAYARQVGSLFAAIHRLPEGELADAERRLDRNRDTIMLEEARRTAEVIEGTETLSVRQRDALLRFLHEEARGFLAGPPKVTHTDLSHHHVYLSRETGTWRVSGIIDWAEAALGPPEWDVVCLWHWTFNGVWHATYTQEWEAMQVCLQMLFAGNQPPERFARRCLAAFLHSPWVFLIWPHFLEQADGSKDIVRDLTAYCFAPDVFGPPD